MEWIITDNNKNSRTVLSLGDSTNDNIFSSNAEIERNGEGQVTKSVKHKVTLQIQPQYHMTADNDGGDFTFNVELVIKV